MRWIRRITPGYAKRSRTVPARVDPLSLERAEVGIRTRVTLGVAIATWCSGSVLGAQTTAEFKDSQVWGLQGLRAGYCVRFLIEPRLASRQLRDGFRLLRADQ